MPQFITDLTKEDFVQHLVQNEPEVQKQICNILGITEGNVVYEPEKNFRNGMTTDFVVLNNDLIVSLIECKGANINVTDFVRGTGQLLQYEHFFEESISPNYRDLEYSTNFKTLFVLPSDVVKNNNFNIADFKYPETSEVLEINIHNYGVRQYQDEDFDRLIRRNQENYIAVSPYYFRDNRLFELYILLKYIVKLQDDGIDSIHRVELENELRERVEVVNNRNWRNAFITLSSLGFIGNDNLSTQLGRAISHLSYEEFISEILFSYMKEYVIEINKAFHAGALNLNNNEITEIIRENNDGKDILFLTESDSRYVSSFLSILRDDFGFISYEPRSTDRSVNYQIDFNNKEDVINNIKIHSKGIKFVEDSLSVLI